MEMSIDSFLRAVFCIGDMLEMMPLVFDEAGLMCHVSSRSFYSTLFFRRSHTWWQLK
jgi:hypothetical protein